jgi:hypothetical protein
MMAMAQMDHELWLQRLRVDLKRQRLQWLEPKQCRSRTCGGGPTSSDDALTPNGGGDSGYGLTPCGGDSYGSTLSGGHPLPPLQLRQRLGSTTSGGSGCGLTSSGDGGWGSTSSSADRGRAVVDRVDGSTLSGGGGTLTPSGSSSYGAFFYFLFISINGTFRR